jgi:hypothetical protein
MEGQPRPGANSSAIAAKLEKLSEDFRKFADEDALWKVELLKKMEREVSAPRSGGNKKENKSGGDAPGSKKKFPTNSLQWFKESYKSTPDEIIALFFTKENMDKLRDHMENDEEAKAKEGDARKNAEILFLWNNFVKSTKLAEKIRQEHISRKADFEKANKTPAKQENDTQSD